MKRLMQPLNLLFALFAIPLMFTLSSFSALPGGEGFEVFRNDELMLQQFGNELKTAKTLQLNDIRSSDRLTIKYYHCGKSGKNRHIIIRGKDHHEIKSWQFANMFTNDPGMTFSLAEILSKKGSKVNVYYKSNEIPTERLLVSLSLQP